jgi:anaerobic ribonucleoside-triphosphate reductase activating protein
MLLHGKIRRSTVNGPGTRAVIHFQYCPLHCTGCWNRETWDAKSEYTTTAFEIKSWIDTLDDDLEGITFSGGEPMAQPWALLAIIQHIKMYRSGWTIGMFTGFTEKELREGTYSTLREKRMIEYNTKWYNTWRAGHWSDIRRYLDFAVMGRFNHLKVTDELPLIGSTNQELKLFTERYAIKDFKPQAVEFTISPEGLVQITGFPVGIHKELDKELWPETIRT